MPVSLHHVVIDTHDLETLPAFWAAALGWKVLSVRPREVVVGAFVDAPVGLCFMPVADDKVTGAESWTVLADPPFFDG